MDEQLIYETKCRRCGQLEEWSFGQRSQIEWFEFSKAMIDYIQYPRARPCKKCKKDTVQDVVYYSGA